MQMEKIIKGKKTVYEQRLELTRREMHRETVTISLRRVSCMQKLYFVSFSRLICKAYTHGALAWVCASGGDHP